MTRHSSIFFKLAFALCLHINWQISHGQFRAIYYQDSVIGVKFDFRNSIKYELSDSFLFPEYEVFDRPLASGMPCKKLTSYKRNKHKEFVFGVYLDISQAFEASSLLTKIYQRLYAKGIEKYTVDLHDKISGLWYQKTFEVKFNGYQIPIQTDLSSWHAIVNNEKKFPEEEIYIDEIFIGYNGQQVEACLAIGQIKVFDVKQVERNVINSFFEQPYFEERPTVSDLINQYYSNWQHNIEPTLPYLKPTLNDFLGSYIHGLIHIMPTEKESRDEKFIFRQLVRQSILRYPFYKERSLNKDEILLKYDSLLIIWEDYGICKIAESVGEFIDHEFKDAHFTVADLKECGIKEVRKTEGPVRFYPFNGQLYVSAVLSEDLENTIKVGAKVVRIDNLNTTAILEANQLKSIVLKERSDSIQVAFLTENNQELETVIPYDLPIKIPARFRREHARFDLNKDSLAYFRINNWYDDTYIRLANHIDEINNSKGLVIDLRGNGGGNSMTMLRVLSMFINEVTVHGHLEVVGQIETNIVVPNNNFHISRDIPIVILADENTACASEWFISTAKKMNNVTLMGTAPTYGALARAYELKFQSGMVLRLNSLMGKYLMEDVLSIEGKGINPDIWLSRTQVSDLIPYDDKVLGMAQNYLIAQRNVVGQFYQKNSSNNSMEESWRPHEDKVQN